MKTSIAEFLSLPYWSRIWIIQEVMLPSKVMIYSGSEEVDLRSFAFVLVRLVCGWPLESKEEEAERCRNLPGFWFMRQKSSNRHLDLELPSLVRNFSNSSCNNKLDRVYAMLSLVKNGHELTIDYDATPETVLRRTMLSCMNKLPPGDWLIAGAILIEALEIWPSDFGEARSPTSNRCLRGKRERLDNSQIAIKCDHSMRISVPVLGEATICIRDSSTEVANWESAICIYLAISNAGDTHIFEYAIGNDASGFGVKYARAHEYVEGHSQNYEETLCHLNETLYFRLDSPSEQVYYLDYSCYKMVFPHYAAYPTTKSLIKWTSPRPKLVKETSTISTNDHSETRQYDSRRLMPANRKFR
jgi:lambda repressor-like predicted transcriptional regulator